MAIDRGLLLAGDIGGTKSYLAVFEFKKGTLELVREGAFASADCKGPHELIGGFLKGEDPSRIKAAVFGVAGPVMGNRSVLTNLGWTVDGDELSEAFGLKRLVLINDLFSLGWGAGLLGKDDFHALQKGDSKTGNAAVIAAGTGLGEAILFWDGSSHVPSASEGGHTDFGPRNGLEIEFLSHLSAKYGHVSYERIVSGPGLENIYEFMRKRSGTKEPEQLKERFAAEGVAPVVSDEAINGTDPVCKATLGLFVSIYGAEAGNLALKSLSTHAVYIGGGIAPKILDILSNGMFMDAFRDKGRFREFMSTIPVHVILNDRTVLFGAANYAASLAGLGPVSRMSAPGPRK